MLAQRAADEAVAEAQAKARQILDDAETKASTMVNEAETNARRQAETERRRLEGEVLELGARRDALVADVDALEQFETDYRARLRRSLESDLELLSSKGSVSLPRPTIHNVEMPVAAADDRRPRVTLGGSHATGSGPAGGARAARARTATVRRGRAAEPGTAGPAARRSGSRPAATPVRDPGAAQAVAAPAPRPAPAPAPPRADAAVGGDGRRPPTPARRSSTPSPEPEHLDDDAFFASLREAVTDETPLGPRDEREPRRAVFDQDDQRRWALPPPGR